RSSGSPTASPTAVRPATSYAVFHTGASALGLSFRYPAAWETRRYRADSSFSSSIVYLANQPMHPPCTTNKTRSGTSTVCGYPIFRLRPGGVEASWSENGFPGWSFEKRARGRLTRIGGRRAKVLIEHQRCPPG